MYASFAIRLIVGSAYWPSRPRPWVARLNGVDPHWGFQREFVKGVYDYSYSSKGTGKNTYIYYHLAPGLYELYYPISWKHDERYFARVSDDGEIERITKDEVIECLKNASSELTS